jgi:hypothetical protein
MYGCVFFSLYTGLCNQSTVISYMLPVDGYVRLTIYNAIVIPPPASYCIV